MIVTLPGDIPGLLRRGSPVLCDIPPTLQGTVCCVDGGPAPDVWVSWDDPDVTDDWVSSVHVRLDLSDPTGRAHAAWWLSGKTNGGTMRLYLARDVLWYGPYAAREPVGAYRHANYQGVVPGLAALGISDNTRLPDGSRWVEVEALRLVCDFERVRRAMRGRS